MRSRIAQGPAGARGARGTVVVIDVLRAFTTAAWATAVGAREIRLVATPEEALALRARDPRLVLVGEVGGRPIPGFDHGNSPERMAELDLRDRTVVLRSSSGVQGALLARETCSHLLLASLVTASATVRAARALGEDVTWLAMGSPERPDDPEDEACAELCDRLFCQHLGGEPPDLARVERMVRSSPAARLALDPAVDWITPGDLEKALEVDRFPFALRAEVEDGALVARSFVPG